MKIEKLKDCLVDALLNGHTGDVIFKDSKTKKKYKLEHISCFEFDCKMKDLTVFIEETKT